MEGIVSKNYESVLEINGRRGVTKIRSYPYDATNEFWRTLYRQLDEIKSSEYGPDMEFCARNEISLSLSDDDGEIISATLRFGRAGS